MSSTTSKRERQRARRAEQRAAAQQAAMRRERARRVRLVLIGVLAAAAVVGLAVFMVRGADATLGVPAAGASGDPLPPFPDDPSADDPAVGAAAPRVAGYDPDGQPVRLGDAGHPQAVSFLAHWCPHCQEEVPEVAAWAEAGSLPEGVEVVAVSTHHDPARPNWPPDAWLEDAGWPGPVLVDHDLTANEAFGARGTPFWVFLDADGTVVARHPGRLTLEQVQAYLEAITAG